MPRALFTNAARTTLSAGINTVAVSATVVDGSVFPSPTGGDYAYLTIEEGAATEIVQLTARSGNTLTIVRGRDGTTGTTFTSAATVSLRLPKIVLDEIWTGIDSKLNSSAVSAYGLTLVDDANAAAARTTLGLGTAATVNTGTSGATIPLLNGTNTWSAPQTIDSSSSLPLQLKRPSSAAGVGARLTNSAGYMEIFAVPTGVGTGGWVLSGDSITINGNTVWHAGNDGAGSGLNADLLDGYNVGTSGATIPLLSTQNTWSGLQILSAAGINFTNSAVARYYTSATHADIAALTGGSAAGLLVEGPVNAHVVIGIQGNDSNDGLYVMDTGNGGAVDYTQVLFSVTNNALTYKGNSVLDASDIGTSGATIPLLNAANTFSAAQTFSPGDTETTFNRSTDTPFTIRFSSAGTTRGYIGMDSTNFQVWDASLSRNLTFNLSTGVLSVTSNTVWHAGNDGPGSGLNADLLDGYNIGTSGGTIPLLNGTNTWSGTQAFNQEPLISNITPAIRFYESDAGVNEKYWRITAASGIFNIQMNNDALGTFNNALRILRSADTATEIELNATTVDLNGNLDVSGTILAANGTAAAPAFAFTSTGFDDGMYLAAANTLGFTTQGTNRLTMSNVAFQLANIGQVRNVDGSAGTPAYSFASDTNTGMYSAGADALAFSTGGVLRLAITAAGEIDLGTSTVQTNSRLRMRKNGNSIEWGHTNTGGYQCALGAEAGSGAPFIVFNGEAGTTSNTYRTRGRLGSGIRSDNNGGMAFFTLTNSNADNQAPTARLTLAASGQATFTGLVVGRNTVGANVNTNNDTGSLSVRSDSSNAASISFHRTSAFAINMGVGTDNVFRIGGWSASNDCFQMSATGDLTMLGNVTAYSDARLKTDVETLDPHKVFEMRGVSFMKDGKKGSGVIAQEMQEVAPELVNDELEYLSVAYGNTVGYLIEGMKYLKAELEAANARIAALEAD